MCTGMYVCERVCVLVCMSVREYVYWYMCVCTGVCEREYVYWYVCERESMGTGICV